MEDLAGFVFAAKSNALVGEVRPASGKFLANLA